jgi:hypothetical protein
LAEQSNSFNENEMPLFYECMLKCAPKLLDTADIVREAMFRQLSPIAWFSGVSRARQTDCEWNLFAMFQNCLRESV